MNLPKKALITNLGKVLEIPGSMHWDTLEYCRLGFVLVYANAAQQLVLTNNVNSVKMKTKLPIHTTILF